MDNDFEKHAEMMALGYFRFLSHIKGVKLDMSMDDDGNMSSIYHIEHDVAGVRNPISIPIAVETGAIKTYIEGITDKG